jgi:glycosyltransferase involved in cell wall biosynthesis/SAM-dependent methyltransferase
VSQLRLLFPIHYPVFGGPHNQALRLAGPLKEHGWTTTVVLPKEPGGAADRLRSAGVDVAVMPLHRLRATIDPREQAALLVRSQMEIRALRDLIREREVDLVQVTGLVNPHAALAARAEGVPIVWQLVDGRAPAVLRRTLTPIARRLADALMFTGQRIADLHTDGVLPRQPSLVFFPPVDPNVFRPRPELRAQARAALRLPSEGPVVGIVANLNPQKGIEDFVRTAALVNRSIPSCHFVIVGAAYATHAGYERTVRHLAYELGVGKQLIFAGARDCVELLYQAMEIKLVTSVPRSEGATTTVIEAMASGLPVIATDVGALREVVADGDTGLLVPPRQPAALAQAVVRLLENPSLRNTMGTRGRARFETRFSIERCVEAHMNAYAAARSRPVQRGSANHASDNITTLSNGRRDPLDRLRRLLRCPACRGGIEWSPDRLNCTGCRRQFSVADGIPVLLLEESDSNHDELDHEHSHGGHRHSSRNELAAKQAAWFDRSVLEAFEISRPHGTPALHAWLLGEKLRRALSGIETVVPGGTALTVCGGSGMDAEYLARAGAMVIASDVSLGAARRAAERARRARLPVLPVVAAVECLPFANRAVDLVLVHDGLHHLENPMDGVAEMTRVADKAVSITEPAKAATTTVAMLLGLADAIEESGNRVARLRPCDLVGALQRDGLRVAFAERYAMYYRHQPGRASRLLSVPGHLPGATAWRAANTLLARFGNKLTVTGLRPPEDESVKC